MVSLFLFLIYFLVRFAWYGYLSNFGSPSVEVEDIFSKSFKSLLYWGTLVSGFLIAFGVSESRSVVNKFAMVFIGTGFFLALNAVPAILQNGSAYYMNGKVNSFFLPSLYVHPWLTKNILGQFAHPNYIGDVMAFGFFPALGLFTYVIYQVLERLRKERLNEVLTQTGSNLLFLLTTISLVLAAVLLVFSRGTIVCFAFGILIFVLCSLMKYPSRRQILILFVALAIGVGIFSQVGSFSKTWAELQTLDKEVKLMGKDEQYVHSGATAFTLKEGMRRAWAMHKDYPIWGVGTLGYSSHAKKYVTSSSQKRRHLTDGVAMNHYLHLLAEEGIGAYIYYLFIFIYILTVLRGLIKIESRYQFVMALAFFSVVMMVLSHAFFNQLMQRHAMSMLVYVAMGINLGILRKDFKHAS